MLVLFIQYFPELSENKNHRHVTRVGCEPTTFATRAFTNKTLVVKAAYSWPTMVHKTCRSDVATESVIPEQGEFVRHHPLSQVRVFSTEASGIFAELL